MKWTNKRKLFDPSEYTLDLGTGNYAQSPQTLVFDDFVRIYFSTRTFDESNGKYKSYISYVDYDKGFKNILDIAGHQVLAPGALGAFDEHGIFPINPVQEGDRITAYTCGWSRRVSVSVETSIGFVESWDGGKTFQRNFNGPLMSATLNEPVLVGDGFVKKYDDQFHMWYIFGQKWMPATAGEPEARVYKIANAQSEDGITWNKYDGQAIIQDVLGPNECQALPTVVKIGEIYHMYFCYRYATDFRTNASRSYTIGYAYSHDLKTWTRDDKLGGFKRSKMGWDSNMACYPHVFKCDDKIYILYNGNEFGKRGFGIAELNV